MEITFLGGSSFKIKGRIATVVIDPYAPIPKVEADVVTVSHSGLTQGKRVEVGGNPIVLTGPGEYEIKEVKVVGVASFQDDKNESEKGKNVIFNMKVDGLNVCHLGLLGQKELTNEQMEEIGNVDIILLPIGKNETFSSVVASKIISELESKIVVPMGSENKEALEKFLKEMGTENVQPESKLVVKGDKLPEEITVFLLEKAK